MPRKTRPSVSVKSTDHMEGMIVRRSSPMAIGSSLLKNTRIKTTALDKDSYREIGLVWRKASTRSEEFELLGRFIKDNYQSGK